MKGRLYAQLQPAGQPLRLQLRPRIGDSVTLLLATAVVAAAAGFEVHEA